MAKDKIVAPGTVQIVATGWTDALLICRKCSKKLHGGFGPDGGQTLRQAVRETLRATGRRGQVGILDTGCLKVCPKRTVTVAYASRPGILGIVPQVYPAASLV